MSRRWYWKAYLVFLASLTIGGLGLSFYWWEETASIDRIAEWLSLPMYLVQLVGLIGFIYWRPIGSVLLWKFVFAATILELGWIMYEFSEPTVTFSAQDAVFLVTISVVGAIIFLPLLIALYIYAFRSGELWSKAT
jgi:hypothetical protein